MHVHVVIGRDASKAGRGVSGVTPEEGGDLLACCFCKACFHNTPACLAGADISQPLAAASHFTWAAQVVVKMAQLHRLTRLLLSVALWAPVAAHRTAHIAYTAAWS